jgi:hypothetical protein
VSEQIAEQTSGESGSSGPSQVAPDSSATQSEPAAAAAQPMQESMQGPTQELTNESMQAPIDVESPGLAPGQGGAGETPRLDAPHSDTGKPDAPRIPGKIMIMSAGERAWDNDGAASEPEREPSASLFGKRRFAALAAVVVLAVAAGALGGALASAGLAHLVGDNASVAGNGALQASVERIDADILALKAGVEHISRLETSQFNRTSDRLDKVEKAQAEPAAKLARLSDAVDKLRVAPAAAPPVAVAPVAAKETTGSISPPAAAPKVELARLPTVEGWVLRDVANGGALIEGRQGIFEVYAGDPVPGLGRVDAIRRQDGHWVVVTSKGLIVAR